MKEMKKSTFWLLVTVIAVLGASVIAQGVAIFGLHSKIDALSPAETQDHNAVASRAPQPNAAQPSNNMLSKGFFDHYENWDPFQEMQAMHDQMNQMFGNAFNRFGNSDDFSSMLKNYSFSPDIDIEDKGEQILVTVSLPGIDESTLKISVENNKLTVSGSSHSESKEEDNGGKILRQERQTGNFYRMITLPSSVNPENIQTENKNGILYITLEKTTED